MTHPVSCEIYSLRQIIYDLELRDAPCLEFWHKGVRTCIQTSHFMDNQLEAAHPRLMNSFWKYKYETEEWVPVFEFHETLTFSQNDLERHLSIERCLDPYVDDPRKVLWWVVPKGLPRKQFYDYPEERARLKEGGAGVDLDDPDWREKFWKLRQERRFAER